MARQSKSFPIPEFHNFIVNESRYIALFVVSGSIKKLFSIDCVNIYIFYYFFQLILPGGKVWDYPTYCDSLTLMW